MLTQMQKIKSKIPEETNEQTLAVYLDDAKMFILSKLYPFVTDFPKDENNEYLLPTRYLSLQVDIAVELYTKQGAEGETAHSENGITRTYSDSIISNNLLRQIIPCANVGGINA